MTLAFDADGLQAYLAEVYPEILVTYPGFRVAQVEAERTVVEIATDARHIRAGGTVSGPTLFALADMSGYACVLARIGRQALAVTTNLNINFMRKAEPGLLRAEGRILKLGKLLMTYDCTITSTVSPGIIAHATGTYAIPPRRD